MHVKTKLAIGGVALLFSIAISGSLQNNISADVVWPPPQLLFVHPHASQQPTDWGKMILTLRAYNGKLYSGYGDWGANTGPITIDGYDLATGAVASEFVFNAHQAASMVQLANKLYLPAIQPNGMDFAWAQAGSPNKWQGSPNPGRFIHVFSAASTGSDLWLVGACGTDACAEHSLNNGDTWEASDRLTQSQPTRTSYCYNGTDAVRYYLGAGFNGKLYVQSPYYDSAKIFSPTTRTWSDGPDLLPGKCDRGGRPSVFKGKLVYTTEPESTSGFQGLTAGYLYSFDGSRVTNVSSKYTSTFASELYDTANPGDGYFYILTFLKDGAKHIIRSADLVTWYQMSAALPVNSRSIEIIGNTGYIGTDDSRIYSVTLAQNVLPFSTKRR
jgi:hypothetical protein